MKTKQIRELAEGDLAAKQKEIRMELMKLYGQVSTGTPPKNPGQIRMMKKTIARINTIRKERKKIGAAQKAPEKRPVKTALKSPSTQTKSVGVNSNA